MIACTCDVTSARGTMPSRGQVPHGLNDSPTTKPVWSEEALLHKSESLALQGFQIYAATLQKRVLLHKSTLSKAQAL